MADLDYKQIGLAAKDLIIGIGAAAAGAKGGPAAAEGVMKAGNGLDRILNMAGVAETRGDKFDRADYAARPAAAKPQNSTVTRPLQAAPPVSPAGTASPAAGNPAPAAPQPEGPQLGDAQITGEHLQDLGWPADKVQQILAGPEKASLAAIVGKETSGARAPSVAATRLMPVEGTALPPSAARAVSTVDGRAIPTLTSVRIQQSSRDA